MRQLLWLSCACLLGCSSPPAESFTLRLTNISEPDAYPFPVGFSPGWVRASRNRPLFVEGEAASDALEWVAEVGDPVLYATEDGVPIPPSFGETYDRTGLGPGESWTVTLDASPGETITLVSMFGVSNDTFLALAIDPFAEGSLGDVTGEARFLDAGTEVNEPLGTGSNQPQNGPGGEPEMGVVAPADPMLPPVRAVVRLELERAE